MLKNYFKIAWRNLWKSKGYSIMNIGGLAIGMASALLIVLWLYNEWSYDMFHHKRDRLYMMGNQMLLNGNLDTWFFTPKPLGPALKDEFPEVANTCRFSSSSGFLLTVNETKLKANGAFVDPSFLDMFDFPLLAGDKNLALERPTDIVISASLAKRLFSKEEALGQTIKIDSANSMTVAGVMADMPGNTRFNEVEYLMPWAYTEKQGNQNNDWGNNSVRTFLELARGTDQASFESKVRNITKRHSNGDIETSTIMHALPHWWLYNKFENGKIVGGRIEMIRAFSFLAAFILLIACINFMNLSTARSEKRAKEVGVRKVSGAYRSSLIKQFLSESLLFSFIAGILAIGMVYYALPPFGKLVDRQLSMDTSNLSFWLFTVSFTVITGLLAGSYPAFYLSSFNPVNVLKGAFRHANRTFNPRKILVVLQFTIAIALIVGTIVIERQIRYGQERENGYDRNNLVYILLEGDIEKNYHLIKQELLDNGIATSITKTLSPLTEVWSATWGVEWQGKAADNNITFDRLRADEQLVKTAGLTLIAGRDFDLSQYPTDSTAALLNASAVMAMGFDDAIGQLVKSNGKEWHVVGVVEDMVMRSPYEPIPPTIIEGANGWFGALHIKFNAALSTSAALAQTEKVFKRYNPEYPFTYNFVDEAYRFKFEDVKTYGILAALFAGLTIIISCLGLFALAAYMAENRSKEIGVRKVLGASVFSITKLLSQEFVIMVFIACLIAFPLAYWAMDNFFLHMYDYRITMGWGIFATAGMGALALALVTVSSRAINAALANPVDSLRDE